jgi:metal-responsive CopG/Arc/MetJ family transcriptional regulator
VFALNRKGMTRPMIDIPKYLVGAVDDFAERENIDRNEAWEQIIQIGLSVENVEPFDENNDRT